MNVHGIAVGLLVALFPVALGAGGAALYIALARRFL